MIVDGLKVTGDQLESVTFQVRGGKGAALPTQIFLIIQSASNELLGHTGYRLTREQAKQLGIELLKLT